MTQAKRFVLANSKFAGKLLLGICLVLSSLTLSGQGCIPGQFQIDGVCTDCDEGFFSTGGLSISCDECPLGRYNDETGQSSCKTCLAGTFNDIQGATSCKPCEEGFTSLDGAIECFAIAAIPTFTEWGIIILALFITLFGLVAIKYNVGFLRKSKS